MSKEEKKKYVESVIETFKFWVADTNEEAESVKYINGWLIDLIHELNQ